MNKNIEDDAKRKAEDILKNAEISAENLKKDRMLEAKENFLRLRAEFEELMKLIEHLKALLADVNLRTEVIKEELAALADDAVLMRRLQHHLVRHRLLQHGLRQRRISSPLARRTHAARAGAVWRGDLGLSSPALRRALPAVLAPQPRALQRPGVRAAGRPSARVADPAAPGGHRVGRVCSHGRGMAANPDPLAGPGPDDGAGLRADRHPGDRLVDWRIPLLRLGRIPGTSQCHQCRKGHRGHHGQQLPSVFPGNRHVLHRSAPIGRWRQARARLGFS